MLVVFRRKRRGDVFLALPAREWQLLFKFACRYETTDYDMTKKTNVARLLDKAGISYELISYDVDEEDLSAVHVAAELGENIEQVFKTIVLRGDKSGHFVCVIPGEREIDLKLAAKVSGNKKCELLPLKELLAATGYVRGGCSPVGMKKKFPTYIHETCTDFPYIYVSAGVRGLQVKIAPKDLVAEIRAEICRLCV